MPVFDVKIVTMYPRTSHKNVESKKIVGTDLKNAVEMLPIAESMRRELMNKYETKTTDDLGRHKIYTITRQLKA
jgi:hypothetical protein